ncbi:cupredoxin domain-containing protein [Microbacterium sp. A82]|uniref:cupredoxin domain-containing protein n=1 Tax=Microbacterium sp. A82 TaxID=3450452 RepID=UPI003F38ADE0
MRIVVVALLAIMLTLTGCAGAGSAADADAPVQVVEIDAANMRFTSDVIEVPVGTRLVIELTNTDELQMHDLVLANGVAGTHLAPGESETIDVGVITEDIDGWCSISNHRAMGMTLTVIAVDPASD